MNRKPTATQTTGFKSWSTLLKIFLFVDYLATLSVAPHYIASYDWLVMMNWENVSGTLPIFSWREGAESVKSSLTGVGAPAAIRTTFLHNIIQKRYQLSQIINLNKNTYKR
jgi:hypothetical protein